MKRIGAVLYDGTSTLAELWPGGRWTVNREGTPDAGAGASLSLYYQNEYGPADGDPALAALHDLARRTGGSLMIDPIPPPHRSPETIS
jgi:hypothetical protein